MSKFDKASLIMMGVAEATILGIMVGSFYLQDRDEIRAYREERRAKKEERKKTKKGYMRMK